MTILETLRDLPLRELVHIRRVLRDRFATAPWPTDVEHVRVPDDPATIEETLRTAHWEGASGWSLKYRGELLNLRRPAGRAPDGTPLEDHLRFRRVDPTDADGTRLEGTGHREPSRFEAEAAHVHQEGLEWLSSEQVAGLLEDAGLPADVIRTDI